MSSPECTVLCTGKPTNATLLGTSCTFKNATFTNCQNACLDPGYQFNSSHTIRGCDQFSSILDFDAIVPQSHPSCNESYVNAVLKLFNGCMEQYCDGDHMDENLGGCPMVNIEFSQAMCGESNANSLGGVMTSILTMTDPATVGVCHSLVRTVNADIGGIGVFVAYTIQIAIVGYLVIGLFIAGPFRRIIDRCHQKYQKRRRQTALQLSGKAPRELTITRPAKSKLVAFLKEQYKLLRETVEGAQDAQSFLMIAGQLALWRAILSNTDRFDALSFYQLENNYLLAVLIGESTMLPVGALLGVLKITRKATTYIIMVSFVTIAFSICTFLLILSKNPHSRLLLSKHPPSLSEIKGIPELDRCGFNSPPIVFCSPDYIVLISSFAAVWLLASAFTVVWVIVITYRMVWTRLLALLERVGLKRRMRRNSLIMSKLREVASLFAFLQFPILFVGFLVLMLFPLLIFVELQRNGAVGEETWTIAQMIAALVFAPVICRYLFASIAILYESISSSGAPEVHKKREVHKKDDYEGKYRTDKKHHERFKRHHAVQHPHGRYLQHQALPDHDSDSECVHDGLVKHHRHTHKPEHEKSQKHRPSRHRHIFSMDSSSSSLSSDEGQDGQEMALGALGTGVGSASNVPLIKVAVDTKDVNPARFGRFPHGRTTAHERFPSYGSYQSANTDSPLLPGAAPSGTSTPPLAGGGDGWPGSPGYFDDPGAAPSNRSSFQAIRYPTPPATRFPLGPGQSDRDFIGAAFPNNDRPNSPSIHGRNGDPGVIYEDFRRMHNLGDIQGQGEEQREVRDGGDNGCDDPGSVSGPTQG